VRAQASNPGFFKYAVILILRNAKRYWSILFFVSAKIMV